MAKVTLMGRDFEVAPYKLGALRRAAQFIDRINAAGGSLAGVESLVAVESDLVGFVLIGLQKVDPTITLEMVDEEVGFDDLSALREAFTSILRESGFKAGEAPAPSPPAEEAGASETASAPSSSS